MSGVSVDRTALRRAYRPAEDAVVAVITRLEDDEKFNSGKGAVFTADGRNELDASIMDGRTRAAGSIAGVTNVRHPILLARKVMEESEHVMLAGKGAEDFAKAKNLELVPNTWFDTPELREALEHHGYRVLEAANGAAAAGGGAAEPGGCASMRPRTCSRTWTCFSAR